MRHRHIFSYCIVLLLTSSYVNGADFLPVSAYDETQAEKAAETFEAFGYADTWHLEDFETSEVAKAGLIIESNDPWSIKQGFSVPGDAEDVRQGFALEATHTSCAASFPKLCPATVTFSFDPSVFESLPSYVGFVWTDAAQASEGSAFPYARVVTTNSQGQESAKLIGAVTPEQGRQTDHVFIGAVDEVGLNSVTITIVTDGSDLGGHFAIDHFQYGSAAMPGDANVDGQVDFLDFLALSKSYGVNSAGWGGGDFDFDGLTGFPDFLQLSKNFGKTDSIRPANAPEPSSCTLVVLGGLTLLLRRRRL